MDSFFVTLAYKDDEELFAQKVILIKMMLKVILGVFLDPSGTEDGASQTGSLEQQMAAQGLTYYNKTLSTGWFIIECAN